MEVREVPAQPGKFEVWLNHTLIVCSNDTDCPGATICAVNQTWQAEINQGNCMCNTFFGFVGALGDELCMYGRAILGINVVSSILGLVVGAMSIHLLARMIIAWRSLRRRDRSLAQARLMPSMSSGSPRSHTDSPRVWFNPVLITLVFSSIGSLLLAAGGIINALATVGFARLYMARTESWSGRQIKRIPESLDYANGIVNSLGYCFSVCCIVILPMTWVGEKPVPVSLQDLTSHTDALDPGSTAKLELAHKSLTLQKSNIIVVVTFSLLFCTVILCAELPFYVVAASILYSDAARPWTTASMISWGVTFSAIILLNIAVLLRIHVLKGSSNIEPGSEIHQLIQRIRNAAVLIILTSIGALISLCVVGLAPALRLTRKYYDEPSCYVNGAYLTNTAGRNFVIIGTGVAVWFVSSPVRKAQRSASQQSGQQQAGQQQSSQQQSGQRGAGSARTQQVTSSIASSRQPGEKEVPASEPPTSAQQHGSTLESSEQYAEALTPQ